MQVFLAKATFLCANGEPSPSGGGQINVERNDVVATAQRISQSSDFRCCEMNRTHGRNLFVVFPSSFHPHALPAAEMSAVEKSE